MKFIEYYCVEVNSSLSHQYISIAGVFSYYGDHAVSSSNQTRRLSVPILRSNGNSHDETSHSNCLCRKDIPLHASECTCRAVAVTLTSVRSDKRRTSASAGTGAVFELRTEGRRHLFMANSSKERKQWIQTIHDAMIGASVTRGDNFLKYQKDNMTKEVPVDTPYDEAMRRYMNMREAISHAHSKEEYICALSGLNGVDAMTVPVEWIKSHLETRNAFSEHEISLCVEQLWKDLCRDSVEINGEILSGDSYCGPDRILGKLARYILNDGRRVHGSHTSSAPCVHRTNSLTTTNRITESQAVSYARDILLCSNRTRSGGDSYYCAEHLCLNRELVAMCPSSVEAKPLSISVGATGLGHVNEPDNSYDVVCGWALVRGSPKKPWMRRYLILGHKVLSCFAEAEPRPHELREKLHLQDAVVVESSTLNKKSPRSQENQQSEILQFSVLLNNKKSRRDFLFEDESSYYLWRYTFEAEANSTVEDSFTKSINLQELEELRLTSSFFEETRESVFSSVAPRILSRNSRSTVDAEINVSAEYKMVTLDPQGEESDTWA